MLSSHFAITATWRCVAFILQGCRRDPRAGRGVTQQYMFTDRWGRVQGCVSSPAMGLTLVLGFRAEQMVRGWGSAPKTLCLSSRPLLVNLMYSHQQPSLETSSKATWRRWRLCWPRRWRGSGVWAREERRMGTEVGRGDYGGEWVGLPIH